MIRRGKGSLKISRNGSNSPHTCTGRDRTNGIPTRPGKKNVTRLAWLGEMGTKMSRKAALSCPSLRVAADTEMI
jgi:hypothetical protein